MNTQNKKIQGTTSVNAAHFFIQNEQDSAQYLHYTEVNSQLSNYSFKPGFVGAAVWKYKNAVKFIRHSRLLNCKLVKCTDVVKTEKQANNEVERIN